MTDPETANNRSTTALLDDARSAVALSCHAGEKAAAAQHRATVLLRGLSGDARAAAPGRVDRAFSRIWRLINPAQHDAAQAPRLIPRIHQLLEFTERVVLDLQPARLANRTTEASQLIAPHPIKSRG